MGELGHWEGAGAPALVEREAPLRAVEEALRRAVEEGGCGATVLVEGGLGLGKTRLLHAAWAAAHRSDLLVLQARAHPLEADFALGVTRQLLLPVVSPGARDRLRLPRRARAALGDVFDSGHERLDHARLEAVSDLLADVARRRPVALLVDDVHWSDAPSLHLLGYLARRVPTLRAVLVASLATGEGADGTAGVDAIGDGPDTLRVILRPFTEPAVGAILQTAIGSVEPDFVRESRAATGGNPALVVELAREPRALGAARGPARRRAVLADPAPAIARAVLARVRRLPETAQAVACALAVLDRTDDIEEAAELAGVAGPRARDALATLRRTGLVAAEGELALAHPVLRRTLLQELGPGGRSDAHRRAAEVLHGRGADPEAVAAHLLDTHDEADPWVGQRLWEAATTAVREEDPRLAIRLLRRAVEEGASDPPPVRLLATLGLLETRLGEPQAIDRLRAACAVGGGAPDGLRAAHVLAWSLLAWGRPQEALAPLEAALAHDGIPDEVREALQVELDGLRTFTGRSPCAPDLAGLPGSPAARARYAYAALGEVLAGRPAGPPRGRRRPLGTPRFRGTATGTVPRDTRLPSRSSSPTGSASPPSGWSRCSQTRGRPGPASPGASAATCAPGCGWLRATSPGPSARRGRRSPTSPRVWGTRSGSGSSPCSSSSSSSARTRSPPPRHWPSCRARCCAATPPRTSCWSLAPGCAPPRGGCSTPMAISRSATGGARRAGTRAPRMLTGAPRRCSSWRSCGVCPRRAGSPTRRRPPRGPSARRDRSPARCVPRRPSARANGARSCSGRRRSPSPAPVPTSRRRECSSTWARAWARRGAGWRRGRR